MTLCYRPQIRSNNNSRKSQEQVDVMPMQEGIHPLFCHTRAYGNPSPLPSFSRKREPTPSSVIPAQAGIHPFIVFHHTNPSIQDLIFQSIRSSIPASTFSSA